jgi:glycerol-3-phosphate dehydrogenase
VAPSSGNSRKEFSFRTRQATWNSLTQRQTPFDALIIGGGIVGAGCLRELALRGVTNVLLVEKRDFASGTSGASSKLIHAGIRYLEQAWNRLKELRLGAAIRDFRFVVDASRERGRLRKIAPHLVANKRIHLVLAANDGRSVVSVMAGTWLYWLIQLLQGQGAARPRLYFRKSAIRSALPELDAARVRAVFTFSDSETDDARLVIENLQSANDLGAAAMNYVELVSWDVKDNLVHARLKNVESGETAAVTARVMINASGAHVDDVARLSAKKPARVLVDRVAGAHVDLYPAVTERSFYVTAADGRLVFLLCRNEDGLKFSRIGTTERRLSPRDSSDHVSPTRAEIEYLMTIAKNFFPKVGIGLDRIIGVDAGIRPLRAREGEPDAFQKSREHEIVRDGPVYHVIGVKLTDYRRVAEEIVSKIRWREHGLEKPGKAGPAPLRPPALGTRMYAETRADEIVTFTMPLHWDDIALRRLGARPRCLRKTDQITLQRVLVRVAELLGWTNEQNDAERARFPTTEPTEKLP